MKLLFLVYFFSDLTTSHAISFQNFNACSTFVMHENRTVPISLVVPTILPEVKCLELFIKSLELSSFFPKESIIVASGDQKDNAEVIKLRKLIQYALVPNLMLILLLNGTELQSTSRNIGANISSQPFISFFDGDDIIHPQRFEILNMVLSQHPEVHVILHMWKQFTTELPIISNISSVNVTLHPYEITHSYKNKIMIAHKKNPNKVRYLIWLFPQYENIANGPSTMDRKVWSAIPQISSRGAEDSIHNCEIIKKGFNVMVINSVLLFYRQRVNNLKIC
jgi:glycosyltransferase involved in cell wall biosynthesis